MDRVKKMKKKLFIGGAYLVIALLLLIYVSYSAYRIRIAATVQMPEALAQKASIYVDYNQKKGPGRDVSGIVLNNIMPNEKADAYKVGGIWNEASASQAGRVLNFKVSNAGLLDEDTGAPGEDHSKLAVKYKLNLVETGVVPLEGILVDKTDNKEYKAVTGDVYQKRTAVFKDTATGQEAEFTFGNQNLETREFTLYLGWNNEKGVYDSSEKKEIATVEIRADITEKAPTVTEPMATPPEVKWYYTKTRPSEASFSEIAH